MKGWHRNLLIAIGLLTVLGSVAYAQVPNPPAAEFPYTGNRTAVWIVAQLHILFAAFILGAPIFVVISEWLGYRKQDLRYDRLAKEVTKVTVILYSMTALTGGLFIFVLLATYPQFTTWLINHFFLIFAVIYPLLFISETIVLYLYFYTWDAMKGEKKARHIALGVLLNLIGAVTLFVIDAQAVAKEAGLGGRINTVMQTCFFAISGVLPRDEAIRHIKAAIQQTYGKRGPVVVERNWNAVDRTLEHLHPVEIPAVASATSVRPPTVPAAAPVKMSRRPAFCRPGREDDTG